MDIARKMEWCLRGPLNVARPRNCVRNVDLYCPSLPPAQTVAMGAKRDIRRSPLKEPGLSDTVTQSAINVEILVTAVSTFSSIISGSFRPCSESDSPNKVWRSEAKNSGGSRTWFSIRIRYLARERGIRLSLDSALSIPETESMSVSITAELKKENQANESRVRIY